MADEQAEARTSSPGRTHPAEDAGRTRGPRGSRGEVRRRITDAALRSFADHGIDGASTRSIAREADCDPALVRYYFASKQVLFDHVTRRPEAVDAQLDAMAALPHDERAGYLAGVVESCWDDPSSRDFWRSLLRSSRTDAAVARQVEDTWAAFVALGTTQEGARAGAREGAREGEKGQDEGAPDEGAQDEGAPGDGRPLGGARTAAWPVEVADGLTRDGDGVGPEGGATGAVSAPDHVRTGRDAAAPIASRRLVDPEDVAPDDEVAPGAVASRDAQERTVTALASITGMLAAVHLWHSERARAVGGPGRARALEDVLVACFTPPRSAPGSDTGE